MTSCTNVKQIDHGASASWVKREYFPPVTGALLKVEGELGAACSRSILPQTPRLHQVRGHTYPSCLSELLRPFSHGLGGHPFALQGSPAGCLTSDFETVGRKCEAAKRRENPA